MIIKEVIAKGKGEWLQIGMRKDSDKQKREWRRPLSELHRETEKG